MTESKYFTVFLHHFTPDSKNVQTPGYSEKVELQKTHLTSVFELTSPDTCCFVSSFSQKFEGRLVRSSI